MRRLERKKQIRALFFARAVHLCDHDMCYRGCILHLHHVSSRVDLHVILMLERQFICFSPISLRPSAFAVIFSPELVLRNPSAFFLCCLHLMHSLLLPAFFHTGVFILWGMHLLACLILLRSCPVLLDALSLLLFCSHLACYQSKGCFCGSCFVHLLQK